MAKNKSLRREIFRKLIHLMELPILVVYSILSIKVSSKIANLAVTALLLILLEMEYIRLEYKLKIPKILDVLRSHERNNITGSIFFVVSTIIAFAAFDYEIALLALMMTVFGDLAAALVGIKFGKVRLFKQKTLEGFAAGAIINLMLGWLFFPSQPTLFVPMAITASIVELLTGKLDDNLTVPLAAGFVGQLLIFWWQIHPELQLGPVVSGLIGLLH